MKKTILSIVATVLVAGAFVFATSSTSKKSNDCCYKGSPCCFKGSPCCEKGK